MHAHPRAGDGALRVGRRARCRPHRSGLDCRARARRRYHGHAGPDGRPGVRQTELRQGPLGARRTRGFGDQDRRRSRRWHDRHGAGARDARVLRAARRPGERRVLLGRHRSQAAGARRRDRGGDRDRLDAARQPPAHRRHGDGVQHTAHRQSRCAAGQLEADEDREPRVAAQGRDRGTGPGRPDVERAPRRPRRCARAAAGAAAPDDLRVER